MEEQFGEELDFMMKSIDSLLGIYAEKGIHGVLTHAAIAAVGEYAALQTAEVPREDSIAWMAMRDFGEMAEQLARTDSPREVIRSIAAVFLADLIGQEKADLFNLHWTFALLVLIYLEAVDIREEGGSSFQAATAAMEAIDAIAGAIRELQGEKDDL